MLSTVLAAFDWDIFWHRIFTGDGTFWLALWRTVYIAVLAQILGVALGLVAALMRMSRLFVLRALSNAYTLVFRGTPVIVQIFYVYLAVNILLGINEGAYMREIIRAGIDSIERGQMEAAKSLGMRYGLAMRRIVLPQAARVIVPPLGNEFNNMLKTTSLLAFIGVTELFQDAEIHYSQNFKPVEYFTAVAFWYLVLTTLWSFVQAWIERKLAASERGDELSFRERMAAAWSPVGAWARR